MFHKNDDTIIKNLKYQNSFIKKTGGIINE